MVRSQPVTISYSVCGSDQMKPRSGNMISPLEFDYCVFVILQKGFLVQTLNKKVWVCDL